MRALLHFVLIPEPQAPQSFTMNLLPALPSPQVARKLVILEGELERLVKRELEVAESVRTPRVASEPGLSPWLWGTLCSGRCFPQAGDPRDRSCL